MAIFGNIKGFFGLPQDDEFLTYEELWEDLVELGEFEDTDLSEYAEFLQKSYNLPEVDVLPYLALQLSKAVSDLFFSEMNGDEEVIPGNLAEVLGDIVLLQSELGLDSEILDFDDSELADLDESSVPELVACMALIAVSGEVSQLVSEYLLNGNLDEDFTDSFEKLTNSLEAFLKCAIKIVGFLAESLGLDTMDIVTLDIDRVIEGLEDSEEEYEEFEETIDEVVEGCIRACEECECDEA